MIPVKVDLPTIWRGCDWPAVTFVWKDHDGNPFDLSHYTPIVGTGGKFSLHPRVTEPTQSVTTLELNSQETSELDIGDYQWDWLWQYTTGYIFPVIFMSGSVPVRQPESPIP